MTLPFTPTYAFPPGGMPPMDADPAATAAIFTTAYAVIPAGVMRDIVTSFLPGWTDTRAWIIARPLSGFAETFAQYAVEIAPHGGSETPEPDPEAEGWLFIAGGEAVLTIADLPHILTAGGYAYLPPGTTWTLKNPGPAHLRLQWVRRRYQPAPGLPAPAPFVTQDADQPIRWMQGTTLWGTTRFVDPADLRHDAHVNIVTLLPGGRIPFAETHIMEHGLYVLQGTARYLLNRDWVTVGPGDFMWLRAFCPQACIATGTEPFRYLLYKDVNRHPALPLFTGGRLGGGVGGGDSPPLPPSPRKSPMIRTEPLTPAAFAPFGDVLDTAGDPDRIINAGLCGRWHDRARLDFTDGRAGISLFRSETRTLPYRLDLLERHPRGSQAFLPLTPDPFLVIVASDDNGRPTGIRAFLTAPGQGINLLRNTWHGVLTPLAPPGLFAVIDRIGEGPNLEEYPLPAPLTVTA